MLVGTPLKSGFPRMPGRTFCSKPYPRRRQDAADDAPGEAQEHDGRHRRTGHQGLILYYHCAITILLLYCYRICHILLFYYYTITILFLCYYWESQGAAASSGISRIRFIHSSNRIPCSSNGSLVLLLVVRRFVESRDVQTVRSPQQ